MSRTKFPDANATFVGENAPPAGTETTGGELNSATVPKGYMIVPEPKTARIQLLVSPTMKEDLKRIALREGRSVNDLCNHALTEYCMLYDK